MSRDGIVGGDICGMGLQPDIINMTCTVRFSGNVAPTMSWRNNNLHVISANNVFNSKVPSSRLTSSMIIQATEQMNGSQITCSLEMIGAHSVSQLPNWTSPSLNTLCM